MVHAALDSSTFDSCVIAYGPEITCYENVPIFLICGGGLIRPYSMQRTIVLDPRELPLSYAGTATNSSSGFSPVPGEELNTQDKMLLEKFKCSPYRSDAGEKFYVVR
jgi:hypothetical protein